ncbi:hypothetical protein ACIBEJ_00360 [Nonomuraea sp. NPDC050790]|uniref:hypothetical protein n=1 Tax=Nonomuraea sp. NPDC050790 TaxID=3364371 RepID=UPI0037AAC44B
MSDVAVKDTEAAAPAVDVAVDPDLVFTTKPKPHLSTESVADRMVAFELDGATYFLVKPRKWEDLLVELEETQARRATGPDVLWAGWDFLERVIVPESLRRLMARVKNDSDDLERADLFLLIPQIIQKLAAKEQQPAPDARPKRARAARTARA